MGSPSAPQRAAQRRAVGRRVKASGRLPGQAAQEHVVGGEVRELDRLALEAILEKDSSFTPQVRARLEELVREINSPQAEKPLVMLDLVKGTRKILGYKVRLRPVEFGELLTRLAAESGS